MTTYHEVQLRPEEVTVLIRHTLNQLWNDHHGDDGCCPQCCSPCAVLHGLELSGRLDALLRYPEPRESWWDRRERRVDRGFLVQAWRRTDCHGG